jgi:flotillin
MFGIEPTVILIAFMMLAVIVVAMWFSVNFYQKCPPNQAMIISGFGAQDGAIPYKIVVGGGALVMPLLQQRSLLSLEVMTVEVPANAPVMSSDGVAIYIACMAQVKVTGDKVSIATAAESFLSKSDDELLAVVHNLVRNQIIATIQKGTGGEVREASSAFIADMSAGLREQLRIVGLSLVSFSFEFDFQKSFQTGVVPVTQT